jgi:hypothetical protein
MSISIWFVKKDTGQRDESLPEQIAQGVDEAIELVRAHKAGAHSDEYIIRVSASGGTLSSGDRERLVAAGADVLP